MQHHTIHISTKSLFLIALFGLSIYIFTLIWHILLLLFVAIIFSTLIDPFATTLQKRKIPRAVAVLIVYIALFGVVAFSLFALVPVVVHDTPALLENVGEYIASFKNHELVQDIFGSSFASQENLLLQTGGPTQNIVSVFSSIGAVFGGLVSTLIVLVITFYLVIQKNPVEKVLHSFVPEGHLPFILSTVNKIREKLGAWLRGQLLLSCIMGVLIFLVLSMFGVKYAAVIALLAGMFEFIPYVGPVLAAVPALFFAFVDGGVVKLIFVLIGLVVVQQFESHVLIPKVMQRAVGLNPIISIVALITGVKLGGIAGGVLAIPVATALQVIIIEIMERKKSLSEVS